MSELKLNPNPPATLLADDAEGYTLTGINKMDLNGYVYNWCSPSGDHKACWMLSTDKWATTIAAQFNAILAEWLTPQELKECRRLNGTNEYPISDACPTHNYCDANMAMAEAFEKAIGFKPDTMNDFHIELWNEAWRLSRVNNYKN